MLKALLVSTETYLLALGERPWDLSDEAAVFNNFLKSHEGNDSPDSVIYISPGTGTK